MVIMKYEDARLLLEDVLEYEYTDSLLNVYVVRDSLKQSTILIQKNIILKLGNEKMNLEEMVINLEKKVLNKDKEISYKDDTIKKTKKEIRKHKRQKIIAIIVAVAGPIITLLLLLLIN